jgi:hypothetical protein
MIIDCISSSFKWICSSQAANIGHLLKGIGLIGIGIGIWIFILKYKFKKYKQKIYHRCSPHTCNVISSAVVCFEREGEFWVKEYPSNDTSFSQEGRTYRVNYCPMCGEKSKKQME